MGISRGLIGGTAVGLALLVAAPPAANAVTVRANLNGFNEVPSSIFTEAHGSFRAKIRARDERLRYRLRYEDFASDVRLAHIHFSRSGTNGGIIVWLCDSTGGGPVGTPPCPPRGGTVEDTIGPDDVVGPAGQGISAGDFDALVEAIFAGATYVNVHSVDFPGGEIRGQIRGRGGDDGDDDDDD